MKEMKPPAIVKADEAACIAQLKQANKNHGAYLAGNARCLESIRAAGGNLIAAKGNVPHGKWGEYMAKHLEFAPRTAQYYMFIARRWEEVENLLESEPELTFYEIRDRLGDDSDEDTEVGSKTPGRAFLTPDAHPEPSEIQAAALAPPTGKDHPATYIPGTPTTPEPEDSPAAESPAPAPSRTTNGHLEPTPSERMKKALACFNAYVRSLPTEMYESFRHGIGLEEQNKRIREEME